MLPQAFIDEISRHKELEILKTSLLGEPEVSIRVNPRKANGLKPVDSDGVVPWCESGFYLAHRPAFTFDPAMHQGLYYVQDASSMALTAVLRHIADGPVRYLDVCAAPGGKTTAALATLPYGSVVVANEYDFKRAEILSENVAKWGNPNVVVSRGDTSRLGKLRGMFDIVAVDAPCSGEGMMRKDSQAIDQWSPSLVAQCTYLQRQIIENIWPALRPGGYLIYSTCTFNTSENEDNLSWIVDTFGAEGVNVPELDSATDVLPGILTGIPCYRFIPGRVRGEGLFIAVLRKPVDGSGNPSQGRGGRLPKESPVSAQVKKWFTEPMAIAHDSEHVYAMPVVNAPFMSEVASKLDTLLIGVDTATVKGRDLIPTHQLVLSQAFNKSTFPTVEVTYEDALRYLRHEGLSLPQGTPRGMVCLTYLGEPLGMVKNIGNRANNLLPKSWRILSQTVPTEAVKVLQL